MIHSPVLGHAGATVGFALPPFAAVEAIDCFRTPEGENNPIKKNVQISQLLP